MLMLGRVLGRECSGDGHDRVQDPQSRGSYDFGRTNFGLNPEYHTINLQRIIIIVIESGSTALFVIQLVRVVLAVIHVPVVERPSIIGAQYVVVAISQMINVIIIRSVHFTSLVLLITFT